MCVCVCVCVKRQNSVVTCCHLKNIHFWSSRRGSVETNLTSIPEDAGSIPGLAQWVKDPVFSMSCGVGHRCGSDLALLWLWRRPKTTVPIRPLAWELPDAMGVALEKQKTNIYIYIHMFINAEHISERIQKNNLPFGIGVRMEVQVEKETYFSL